MTDRYSFGICSWCLPADQETACGMAAQIGLDGIEVDLGKVEDGLPLSVPENQRRLLAAATEAGIRIPTIAANTLCDHGMSNPAEKAVVRDILSTLANVARAMNIKLIQLPSFIDGFINNDDELRLTANHLKYICERAMDSGTTVGTENAISADDNLRLLEMVDAPNLRVYFDTSNPRWFSDMDAVPMIEQLRPHLCELHVKDQTLAPGAKKPHFVPLGTGGSSFREAAAMIVRSGFRGWIHLENSYPVNGDTPIQAALNALASDVEMMKATFI